MIVWRITREKFLASAFSGAGAEKIGGRWNHKGTPIVYTSENLSLAALELFVHVSPGLIPADLVAIACKLPGSATGEEILASDLPHNWRNYPAPETLPSIGTDWIRRGDSLILHVPSAINPVERNVLINPSHQQFKELEIQVAQPFRFDPRMFGK